MALKLPAWAVTVLGLLAGAAAILNETVLGLPADWRSYITVALVFASGLGIAPLVGGAFRAALHLSQSATIVISSALAALALAVHTLNVSTGIRGVLQFVLTFLAAAGFGPSSTARR